jgi:carboxymethylenebutenolidase
MIEFPADAGTARGYLAVPKQGAGPSVLVLHAWWGLTEVFTRVCDRLAAEGFVALAPDLYHGATTAAIEEAESLASRLSASEERAILTAAVTSLRAHPAVQGTAIGVIGFSMGGSGALLLSTLRPGDIAAVVTFYGSTEADYASAQAAYLGHFAEQDEWEPLGDVRRVQDQLGAAGRDVTFHVYPGAKHWFFEENRPDAYDAAAAHLAWERTIAFLHRHLDTA